jgi:hypothetical protein
VPDDPFGTAGIRERVLAGWAAAPARFREDANAEEDLVRGAYRDRLVVELAQNAADAAARAGVPGVLHLSVVDGELRAANTGAALTAQGVQALATLRASAKRGSETVGRFGVGFAAAVAVSDEPAVLSVSGGVRFSAAGTRAAAGELPALAGELARRGGQVPVLRLPWPDPRRPPAGFATEVRLPLRDPAVGRALLAGVSADLLLALPGLARIELPDRELSRVDDGADAVLHEGGTATRWRTVRRSGTLPPELLADRPVEERERPEWAVTWAIPVTGEELPAPLPGRQVVHAPTPSDEPLSMPARLIASFPLDPARRHVAPGPLTDALVAAAGAAYAELVATFAGSPAALRLVPRPALAAANLDAALARATLVALRDRRWLPGGAAPAGAVVIDAGSPELVAALDDVLPGLLPAAWSGRGLAPALDVLGVRRLSTADVVELLSGLDRPPGWWYRLYAALEYADREALSGLPVPLADGRVVTGPRGLLLPMADLPAGGLDALGLRVVHAGAAHPLLERLGAVPATAAGVLADGRVRAAVEASYDDPDPEPVASAVLALVAALVAGGGIRPGTLPWLADLALPSTGGDWLPAGELLLPGSALAGVMAEDSPFEVLDPALLDRYGPDPLRAVGVLDSFAMLTESDVDTSSPEHDLDGEEEYYAAVADRLPVQDVPVRLATLVAVRDLELVRPDAWPVALALLAEGPLRAEAGQPAVAVLADGSRVEVLPYTRWWLSTHRVLAGRRPVEFRLPGATTLAGLYDVPPGPPELAEAAGCLSGVDDVLADPELAADLLGRLGDPARTADPRLLRTVYGRLALVLDGFDVPPPARVRVAPGLVLSTTDTVVLDAPYLLPLLADRAVVPAGGQPGAVADLLDVPFASELVRGRVTSAPVRVVPWPALPGAALAAERCGGAAPVGQVAVHDPLLVSGRPAPWWPDGEVDHVDVAAGAAALGRAIAWRLGRWSQRAAAAEALAPGADGAVLRAEDAAGDPDRRQGDSPGPAAPAAGGPAGTVPGRPVPR